MLGQTSLKVSRLCFGTAELGLLEQSLSAEASAQISVEAWKRGVNFWDTSDDYGTHVHVRGVHTDDPERAIRFVARLRYVDTRCIGMTSVAQVEMSLR